MNTQLGLAVVTAGVLFTGMVAGVAAQTLQSSPVVGPAGGVVVQTPQTIPVNPIEARRAILAARAARLAQRVPFGAPNSAPPQASGSGPAPTGEAVLYAFENSAPKGQFPYAGLILGWDGNLYGTAALGGNSAVCPEAGCGVIFKMDQFGNKTVLYAFKGGADGTNPETGSLLLDNADNLYGATAGGGDSTGCFGGGCGVVFKLDKFGKETVLYTFTGGTDGAAPYGSLIEDQAGNLYGTASYGGITPGFSGSGVVFKLDRSGKETVLYTFTGGADGNGPNAGLILDQAGNLYGTTVVGGDLSACPSYGCGVVFKVDKFGNETVLHTFTGGADGAYPNEGLIRDNAGNFYGTAYSGGDLSACSGSGCGAVFKLDNSGKETVLYSFMGTIDGAYPYVGVVRDGAGNLFGATANGGDQNACSGHGCGVVFKVGTSGSEDVLHSFTGGTDGSGPFGSPILDPQGNLFGTTADGGLASFGTVYELDRNGKETVFPFVGSASGSLPFEGVARNSIGNIYGSTSGGGTYDSGLVYKLDNQGCESALYTFTGGSDGSAPNNVIVDSADNIYGTTASGGAKASGVVFKVDPSGKETVLYSFTGGADGGSPGLGGLVRDSAGNLFGTTGSGGNLSGCYGGCGVVFKVDPSGKETVLYTFTGGADGANPNGGLIADSAGNLYGTTAANAGIVFKLDPHGNETTLYRFTGLADGNRPFAGLVRDSAGNLYGTTAYGGGAGSCFSEGGCGVVFKLTASGIETVLHSFTGGADGGYVTGSLVLDSSGNLFGTAYGGGNLTVCQGGGCGVVFQVDASGTQTPLHTFTGGTDGAHPQAGMIADPAGNLYGTAVFSGADGGGVVFEIPGCAHAGGCTSH